MKFNLIPEVSEFVFDSDIYFKESHASTLVELPNGNIVVAWFGGSKEGEPDVAIWQSIRENGVWSKPCKIADEENVPHWNPVFFFQDDILYLFYRTGHEIPNWKSWVIKSLDFGRSYSSREPLPENFLGPIKNKPLRMSNGKWLLPSSIETDTKWYCKMEILDVEDWQWKESNTIESDDPPCRIIQPTVWESKAGNIHALIRSSMGVVYRSDSLDYGESWSKPCRTELPNPDSGIDCIKLDSGEIVLVYNPNYEPSEKIILSQRTPLVLGVSHDNGTTWKNEYTLENEPGEYSYPSIVATDTGFCLTYTWNRKKVKFWSFNVIKS